MLLLASLHQSCRQYWMSRQTKAQMHRVAKVASVCNIMLIFYMGFNGEKRCVFYTIWQGGSVAACLARPLRMTPAPCSRVAGRPGVNVKGWVFLSLRNVWVLKASGFGGAEGGISSGIYADNCLCRVPHSGCFILLSSLFFLWNSEQNPRHHQSWVLGWKCLFCRLRRSETKVIFPREGP